RLLRSSPWLVLVYFCAATLPCDALSAFLVFCDRVVYPSYLSAPRLSSLAPLHDQEFAGALMWVSVTLIYLLPAVVITIELLSPPRTDSRSRSIPRPPSRSGGRTVDPSPDVPLEARLARHRPEAGTRTGARPGSGSGTGRTSWAASSQRCDASGSQRTGSMRAAIAGGCWNCRATVCSLLEASAG